LLLGSKYLPRSAAGFHGEELLLYEACAKLMPKDKIVPKSSVSRRYASEYWLVGEVEGVGFKNKLRRLKPVCKESDESV
jgi:hypothetical protein